MTAARCVQNFNHRRALIVSEDTRALGCLDDYLMRLGVGVQYLPLDTDPVDLNAFSLAPETDVLFLDGDLNSAISVPLHPGSDLPILPVIGMVGIEAPSRLGRLFANGASAFIKKPIHVGTVFFSLFMAVNSHNRRASLIRKTRDLEARRQLRRYVVKAVLMLMERLDIDDEHAYALLRKQSMHAQTSIEDYCRLLIERHQRSEGALFGKECAVGQL